MHTYNLRIFDFAVGSVIKCVKGAHRNLAT